MKYQAEATYWNADNLRGTLNAWLGEAGFRTTNKAYYGRIFDAMEQGDEQTAADLREYLTLGKGVKDTTIESGIKSAAKERLEAAEASRFMIDNGMMDSTSTLTGQFKAGEITEDEYREMYKAVKPDATEDDIWWKIDQIQYQNETGSADTPSGYYYRIRNAVDGNKAADIQKTVKDAMAHGRTQKNILDLASDWKAEYLAADSAGKIRIRDAIHKLYKAAGSTAEAADKKINKWKDDGKGQQEKQTTGQKSQDTTGRWGKGNIDLNNRKVVHNSDGSISTEFSFTVGFDGKSVLLPSVVNGKIVSEEEAIDHYLKTGEYLGIFDNEEEAQEYAQMLHERQEWYYRNK
jgi:hypothetical protein